MKILKSNMIFPDKIYNLGNISFPEENLFDCWAKANYKQIRDLYLKEKEIGIIVPAFCDFAKDCFQHPEMFKSILN